jgi:hypothetical protein
MSISKLMHGNQASGLLLKFPRNLFIGVLYDEAAASVASNYDTHVRAPT